MSELVNVRKAFSYQLESSSISYIRNYNFSTSQNTVTDIPCRLLNSSDDYDLTVVMSGSVPWIKIIDQYGTDITFPNGLIEVPRESSTTVTVRIDLPPAIEALPETLVTPQILFKVSSGSIGGDPADKVGRLIISGDAGDPVKTFVSPATLRVGQLSNKIRLVIVTEGKETVPTRVDWSINSGSIAEIIDKEPIFQNGVFTGQYSTLPIPRSNERYILGKASGSALVTAQTPYGQRLVIPVVVTAVTGTQGNQGSQGNQGTQGNQGRVPNPEGPGPAGPQGVPVGGLAVESIQLIPTNLTIRIDETVQLRSILRNSADNILPNEGITWRSLDRNVARVSTTGEVSGLSTGTTTITATKEGKQAQSFIVVIPG